MFYSKCSYGHVEGTLGKALTIFLRRSQKKIAYCRILLKKVENIGKKTPNNCYRNLNCSFAIPTEIVLTKTKNFRSLANNDREVSFPENWFPKDFLPHLDSNFDNSAENFFCHEVQEILLLVQKEYQ